MTATAETRRRKLDQDLAVGEKELPDGLALPGGSDVLRLQRSIEYVEVRRLLATLPDTERVAEIQMAAERGDRDLILALQVAPKWVRDRLVPPEVFAKAQARFLELTQPDAFKKISTIREALGNDEANAARTRQVIAQATTDRL